ncbi:MAG: CHAT domain-containing protein [bacterium]
MTDEHRDKDKEKEEAADSGDSGEKEIPTSVDSILQARLKLEEEKASLDKMLKDKFQKNTTVMFTDIKGSTSYFETFGDVEGRAMVQRHNAMLFPIIEGHGGKVIKTIGDAIMATFEDPAEGVKAGMEMQKKLTDYNKEQDQKHLRIMIRIGLNYGPAVVEENDVFGDAVNVAARVESQADAGELLVSESLYKEVRSEEEVLVRFFGEVSVKGKAEPVKLYRVIWSEEQLIAEGEFKKAATRRSADKRGLVARGKVMEMAASREEGKLKLSVFERQRGEEKTVSQYDVVKLDDDLIRTQCEEVVSLLNRSNKRGKVSKEILTQLQSAGQILFDHLLTQEAKERIIHSQAEHLIIRMDDRLVHIPWELLFDGKQFFCQRFGMGRIVSTRQKVAEVTDRHIAKPLRMLVVADPRSDLPASKTEGVELRDELDREHESINVNLKTSEVQVNYVKSKIRNYDLVHYAGHADYDRDDPGNSGWLLADGKLSSSDVRTMTGKKPMPALVFANGCQSGQTEEWKIDSGYENDIFGLANAFLVSGVQHYIGTFWDILDDPGKDFALAFYQEMVAGYTVGESMRRARLHLIDKYGEDTIVWASYMLYGDPTYSYLAEVAEAEDTEEVHAPAAHAESRPLTAPGRQAVLRGADSQAMPRSQGMSKSVLGVIAAVIVVALLAGWYFLGGSGDKLPSDSLDKGYALLEQGKPDKAKAFFDSQAKSKGPGQAMALEGLAAVSLAGNNLIDARDYAGQALKVEPQSSYAHVILGKIAYNRENYQKAAEHFQSATQATSGKDWQKQEAYEMLGKVHNRRGLSMSNKGDKKAAADSYKAALDASPDNAQAAINLGQSYLSMGKTAQAKKAFARAKKADPDNQVAMMMLHQVSRMIEMQADAKKSAETNRLARELAEKYKSGDIPKPANAGDEWTSRPFTLTMLDFEPTGRMTMAGEFEFIRVALTQKLQDKERIEVLEREMIDKVLQELNLSSGALASKETRTRLGRLMGAAFIATGKYIRSGGQVQVIVRLVETETTRAKVSIAPVFEADKSPAEIAEATANKLMDKIREEYPVKGKITEVKDNSVKLNIGSKAGVEKGMKMEILDQDLLTIGSVKINNVGPDVAMAEILEKPAGFKKGMKVREVKE